MSEVEQQQSPLQRIGLDRPAEASGVRLREIPFQGHLNLRGRPGDGAFLDAVTRVLGVEPPRQPNTFVTAGELKLFWLGPDEWLVVTPPGRQTALAATLEQALQGLFSSVTDLSSGQTMIAISGPNARALLEMGCPLDLHPRRFGPGDCAQTRLEQAAVLIGLVDDTPRYEVVVRRSFADYLGAWLLDALESFSGDGAEPGGRGEVW